MYKRKCWLAEEESCVAELDCSSQSFKDQDVCHSKLESEFWKLDFNSFDWIKKILLLNTVFKAMIQIYNTISIYVIQIQI